MLVTSIFSFPTMFSKVFFLRVVKSWDYVGKGLSFWGSHRLFQMSKIKIRPWKLAVRSWIYFVRFLDETFVKEFLVGLSMLYLQWLKEIRFTNLVLKELMTSLTFSKQLYVLTLSQTTNFRLKEFADDNFKFDENGRMFSNPIENTVEKGEIARYKQFLLFPQCFHKTCTADT